MASPRLLFGIFGIEPCVVRERGGAAAREIVTWSTAAGREARRAVNRLDVSYRSELRESVRGKVEQTLHDSEALLANSKRIATQLIEIGASGNCDVAIGKKDHSRMPEWMKPRWQFQVSLLER